MHNNNKGNGDSSSTSHGNIRFETLSPDDIISRSGHQYTYILGGVGAAVLILAALIYSRTIRPNSGSHGYGPLGVTRGIGGRASYIGRGTQSLGLPRSSSMGSLSSRVSRNSMNQGFGNTRGPSPYESRSGRRIRIFRH